MIYQKDTVLFVCVFSWIYSKVFVENEAFLYTFLELHIVNNNIYEMAEVAATSKMKLR